MKQKQFQVEIRNVKLKASKKSARSLEQAFLEIFLLHASPWRKP